MGTAKVSELTAASSAATTDLFEIETNAGASRKLTTAQLITLLDTLYQALDGDLTSWAAVARAAGFDAFAATPSSANLATLLSNEVGSVAVAFQSEDVWTPVLTFATAGDLAVAYTTQVGTYTRTGNLVTANCSLLLSSFAHGTASGNLQITGLPFTSKTVAGSGYQTMGSMRFEGITKASYTQFNPQIASNAAIVTILASRPDAGAGAATVTAADMPTGGTVRVIFTLTYQV